MLFKAMHFHLRAFSTHCLHGPPITLKPFASLEPSWLKLDQTRNRNFGLLIPLSVTLTACAMNLSICWSLCIQGSKPLTPLFRCGEHRESPYVASYATSLIAKSPRRC